MEINRTLYHSAFAAALNLAARMIDRPMHVSSPPHMLNLQPQIVLRWSDGEWHDPGMSSSFHDLDPATTSATANFDGACHRTGGPPEELARLLAAGLFADWQHLLFMQFNTRRERWLQLGAEGTIEVNGIVMPDEVHETERPIRFHERHMLLAREFDRTRALRCEQDVFCSFRAFGPRAPWRSFAEFTDVDETDPLLDEDRTPRKLILGTSSRNGLVEAIDEFADICSGFVPLTYSVIVDVDLGNCVRVTRRWREHAEEQGLHLSRKARTGAPAGMK